MNIKDIIPKDWKLVRLSEISELITKGTTPTTNGYTYLNEGVNFVKVESIHANGSFIPRMFAHVGEDCHNSFKRSQLKSDDILFTIAGALGRSTLVTDDILPANTNQAVAIIRLKNLEYKNYIFHYLRGNYIKNLIDKINVSTAQANLSLGQINQFEIPLPPLTEQQKIAEILSTVDAKIEVIDQQITETQALKKGLMQRLLTKGIGHTEFKDSPLGEIPKSWEAVKLEDIVKDFIVPMRDKPKKFDGDIPWCRIEDFNGIYLEKSKSNQNVSEQTIKEMNLKVYPVGTVLVSCSANLGKCAITKKPLLTNQTFIGLNVKDSFYNKFLYYKMLFSAKKLNTLSSGTTISYLSRKEFENFEITVPTSRIEQEEISTILFSVDEKLEVLSEKKTHYQELKQGLMQQLLTGKIRVKTNNTVTA
jgi:type I restriction enzyme S subunit